ncbi:hypothetical protein [Blastococcus sp. TF02A-35]|uniref:hypothetical protein n=1 Tax=Blastococcus sp. TF02A-35 TaxID=2559612 RepID=UPI001072F855|nr:hypothetical protein [Blastococcus sp. TF02A_35]TFV52482.1 hypothetical protein E4P43_05665 [Blastococcus sp. TF02A_35]
MAREIPEVVRAAAGLAATVLDEARKLPETLPGLPVRVIGMAMQHAMKAQQTYAGLVARGDELLTGLRGDSEPGLATFDDDVEPVTVTQPSNGVRDSAFDRVSDDDVAPVLAAAEEAGVDVDDAVVDSADGVATAEQAIDVAEEAPSTEEVLDELAIDEAVPEVADTDPLTAAGGGEDAPVTEDADALESALLESGDAAPAGTTETADVATTVDVLTPEGDVETVEAAVTDEGIAAVEAPQDEAGTDETVATTDAAGTDTASTDTASTDTETVAVDEGGSPVAAATDDTPADDTAAEGGGSGDQAPSSAPATEPVDGYDSFSIAQLRGRLRGYALSTVADLLAYEEANRAREPYLRMLRNRLEKLEEQAVESSPLAPRGL